MKRITRKRKLTAKEAKERNAIRAKVAKELTELIARQRRKP